MDTIIASKNVTNIPCQMAQVKAILHYIDAILLTSAGQILFLPYDEGASSPCVAMSSIFIFRE